MRPDKRSGTARSAGFTLIELLVVVLIIGITVGLVVISIDPGEEDDIKLEARRLQELIRLASQEAIMQSNEYALEISDDGYRFLFLAKQKWMPVEDPMLRARTLPDALYLEVFFDGAPFDFMKTEQEDTEEEDEKPRVYLFSSGEITPVEIVLQAENSEARYHVVTEINGKVSLEANDDEAQP
ncbi:MAG TPA: type II secretion system protein GspH [Gammaproteobacteria bacterium]|nr:type II secretion system protein GspH [Gammaproteobacteria bacterium]